MNPHERDGLLAGGVLLVLAAGGTLTVGATPLVRPLAVVVGIGGGLVIEGAFLRYPDRLLVVWRTPGVALASAAAVACLGVGAVLFVPWLFGAVVWGLLTYLALLAFVLAGFRNPLAVFVSADDRE